MDILVTVAALIFITILKSLVVRKLGKYVGLDKRNPPKEKVHTKL